MVECRPYASRPIFSYISMSICNYYCIFIIYNAYLQPTDFIKLSILKHIFKLYFISNFDLGLRPYLSYELCFNQEFITKPVCYRYIRDQTV